MIVEIHNEQACLPADPRHRRAVRMILEDASLGRAQVSVAVVDDPTIRRLHREYLGEDSPTDVMSFVLERDDDYLEGEVVASAQTACAAAPEFGWPAADELLLYVIHGALHLVGYDDTSPRLRAEMRKQERAYLARFGLDGRYRKSTEKSAGKPAARPAKKSTAKAAGKPTAKPAGKPTSKPRKTKAGKEIA